MKDHSIKNQIKRLLKVITPSLIGRAGVGLLLFPLAASAQITQSQMEQIYETVKTPYKYGLVVLPPITIINTTVPRCSVTTAGGI